MTLFQALVYFFREAGVNLARSWKVSLVAVVTIGVSLFVGGAFLVVSGNLARAVERWQRETKVVVYLEPEASEEELAAAAAEVGDEPWVTSVEAVSQARARERFRRLFPSLSGLVEDAQEDPLPASVEIGFDPARADSGRFADWVEQLRERPRVAMVDDDREWLGQLETLVTLARALGLGLGAVLLAAAVFTIAGVVRLTAYLYHDEIAIMRLVGATEFFIRGPFYAEGLIQGLAGGLLAAAALFGAYQAVAPTAAATAWGAVATGRFLSAGELSALVLVGAAAGLVGAIASLRKEKLGAAESA